MIRLKLEKDQLLPVLVQKYEIFLTNLLKNRGEKLEELARVCNEPWYLWLTSASEYTACQEGLSITNITNNMSGGIKLVDGNVSLIEKSFKTIKSVLSDTEKTEESEKSVDIIHLASRLANCVLNNVPSYEGWSPNTIVTIVDREISRIENLIKSENNEINKILKSFDLINFTSNISEK